MECDVTIHKISNNSIKMICFQTFFLYRFSVFGPVENIGRDVGLWQNNSLLLFFIFEDVFTGRFLPYLFIYSTSGDNIVHKL